MRTHFQLVLLSLAASANALFCPDDTPTGCIFLWFGYTLRRGDPDSPDCDETCALIPPLIAGYECGTCNPVPPTVSPSASPSKSPSAQPSKRPTKMPGPTNKPSARPSSRPSAKPSSHPSTTPSSAPSSTPSKLPTKEPTPPPGPTPPVPTFDIQLDFASTVPTDDQPIMEAAKARWEKVISQDLPEVSGIVLNGIRPPPPGCTYPFEIDDVFICIFYGEITEPGILGVGMVEAFRSANGIPIAGSIKLKSGVTDFGGSKLGLFTKEIGHVLGLGKDGKCPGPQADLEYARIKGCVDEVNAEVPAEADCLHFLESCLGEEVMTPIVGPNPTILSKMTVGWLQDVNFMSSKLNYNDADAYTASDLDETCTCNRRRRFLSSIRSAEENPTRELVGKALSEAGLQAARDFGKRYLEERYEEGILKRIGEVPSDPEIVDAEAREAFVIVREAGVTFVVRVTR